MLATEFVKRDFGKGKVRKAGGGDRRGAEGKGTCEAGEKQGDGREGNPYQQV